MRFSLTFSLLLAALIGYAQNILIADNNAGAPAGSHVFSTLQAAVDASSAGDIIHVIPSPTNYGTVNIDANDSISIYGIGFRPDKDGPALSTVQYVNIYGSNVKISGLKITSSLTLGTSSRSISNIAIENCDIQVISSSTSSTFTGSNILIRNCYLVRETYNGSYPVNLSDRISNSVISNCIIGGYNGASYGTMRAYNGTVIKNNIFFGDGEAGKHAFYSLENCSVTNNIFYGRPPSAQYTLLNVTFNNNVAVGSVSNTLPPQTTNGVTGSNNFTAITDPAAIFADAAITIGDVWEMTWSPALATSATALLGGGTDGTDVGPAGSTLPWNPTGVPLPLVQSVITSEVIKQGDDLNITIKARGN